MIAQTPAFTVRQDQGNTLNRLRFPSGTKASCPMAAPMHAWLFVHLRHSQRRLYLWSQRLVRGFRGVTLMGGVPKVGTAAVTTQHLFVRERRSEASAPSNA